MHGMALRHKLGNVCKTHTQLSKHVKHVQSRVNPNIWTHLSPIQHKNVTWTFCQTLSMQHCTTWMNNAWTQRNLPKYKCKMPQGAHTNTHEPNGTQPNQNLKKFWLKSRIPTLFRKIPNFRILRKFLHNLRQKWKECLRKHTLKWFCRDLCLKMMGF